MNIGASPDDETLALLRDSMTRFGQQHYRFDQRRAWLGQGIGYSVDAWREYAALGWLGIALPAQYGGFAGEPKTFSALMEYVGATLALEPVHTHALWCARLLAASPDRRAASCLESIAVGNPIFAFAHIESAEDGVTGPIRTRLNGSRLTGTKLLTLHGDVADRLVVSARSADDRRTLLCLVDPNSPGVLIERFRLLDGRGAASFQLREAAAEVLAPDDDADSLIEETLDAARLAMCSETLGAIVALNGITNGHLKTRRQFGRPLAFNQALQHRMVDLYILQEELRAVIDAAHRVWSGPASPRIRAISAAAAHAAMVARQTAHEAVQLHGGIGITAELAVSHYFKRLMVTARLLGDRDAHLERFTSTSDLST